MYCKWYTNYHRNQWQIWLWYTYLTMAATSTPVAMSTALHWQKLQPTMLLQLEMGSEVPVKCIKTALSYTCDTWICILLPWINPPLTLSVFKCLFQLIIPWLRAESLMKMWCEAIWCSFINYWMRQMTLATHRFVSLMSFWLHISLGNAKTQDEPKLSQLTLQVTRAIDWHWEGICHKRNEVLLIF